MLKQLAANLEQLDLAYDHLMLGDANNARFALMLTDNAIEITLHQIAERQAGSNRSWSRDKEFKYERELADALGRNFEPKVKFARLMGHFSQEVGETIFTAHGYRNEVYHIGVKHEELLPALSRFYFSVACDVLATLKSIGIGWGSNLKIPERAKKYFPNHDRRFMPGSWEEYRAGCSLLASKVSGSDEALRAHLASHMDRVITEKDDFIKYLQGGYPRDERPTREQIVIDCQAWPVTFSDAGKAFLRSNPPPGKSVHGYVQWIGEHYPFQYRNDPIPSWRKRLLGVRGEKNPHRALRKYQMFMDETSAVRGWIDEATSALDARVEEEIERMRGN
ncbi:hypothetical protein [Mesorhizobium sp. B2-7-1]|uniref:hypothetical protein n=1 Tax=Mesorhizobium sp. B2-7-1 TaxID=2589909 RepID=UPI0011268B32|nr:hypothetical protein [Mesorhizobium sp. B2-7-1]TPJ41052.1 hypothetical protein FJ471_33770 [Mesorhizobium sp. B2-7-1]